MCFEIVGYLLEELRDSTNLDAFKRDLEDANVFIGSLIFIEELAEKVRVVAVSEGCFWHAQLWGCGACQRKREVWAGRGSCRAVGMGHMGLYAHMHSQQPWWSLAVCK